MSKLIRNAAECLTCGDIVESRYCHDFKSCKCGEIFVDGGLDYARFGYKSEDTIVNLCEYEEEK